MGQDQDTQDWGSYRRLILSDLHEIKKEVHELRILQQQRNFSHQQDMGSLKIKVATISGIISTTVSLVAAWLSGVFRP